MALAEELALRISSSGGAALIVDYGSDHALPHSLRWFPSSQFARAIRSHQGQSVLSSPGHADLSISVDFSALARTAEQATKVEAAIGLNSLQGKVTAHGPVDQGLFLHLMGIEQRLERLAQAWASP